MRLTFDDNDAFEYFQFLWFAVTRNVATTKSDLRLRVEDRLRTKLAAVSQDNGKGGRNLIRPCQLDITADERLILAECICETPWQDEAKPMALRTAQFIGIEIRVSLPAEEAGAL